MLLGLSKNDIIVLLGLRSLSSQGEAICFSLQPNSASFYMQFILFAYLGSVDILFGFCQTCMWVIWLTDEAPMVGQTPGGVARLSKQVTVTLKRKWLLKIHREFKSGRLIWQFILVKKKGLWLRKQSLGVKTSWQCLSSWRTSSRLCPRVKLRKRSAIMKFRIQTIYGAPSHLVPGTLFLLDRALRGTILHGIDVVCYADDMFDCKINIFSFFLTKWGGRTVTSHYW